MKERMNEYISELWNEETYWALKDSPDIQETCLQDKPLWNCTEILFCFGYACGVWKFLGRDWTWAIAATPATAMTIPDP